ncbi:PP2C family protein-serine/threonine phosphatase [Caldinitratiruptor microaerophilus]|nr:PP2C family protein-serine/threonine phosphatase [Caldinitratiruptor microaerophilus]
MGGDYFDFLLTPRGTVRMCVGDVMGKGLAASMLMLMARVAIRALSDIADSPGTLLHEANRILYPDFHRLGSFLTLCFIEYHPATRALACANAGHLRPLIYRSAREIVEVDVNGMMMGVLPDSSYEVTSLTLSPGDTVILYSDGVIEATRPDRQPIGKRGFYEILRGLPPELPLPVLQERVLQALRQHTGAQPQRDDMTLAFLRAGAPADQKV